ncbi:properdin-like [Osmerus mordax]|uniref:properdin-like n=1 Tax=Osmerus mordax TaxID=8014 RepID=UPI003510B21C
MGLQQSGGQGVKCFTRFNSASGGCENLLGDVELDDCCMNINYAYTGPDGACLSCGLPTWCKWSPWGRCSVPCKEGVAFRKRRCDGQGICPSDKLGTLQMQPCKVTDCCPEESVWAEWGAWEACSSTCDRQGTRLRHRSCSAKEGACSTKCEGSSVERGPCSVKVPCPVDGQWSTWDAWQPCSSLCVQEGASLSTRTRLRSCTAPSPSTHTTPPGRLCPGPGTETEDCHGLPYCPVHGAWGAWAPWQACSVTCGVGVQKQGRVCDSPAPKHRGNPCPGSNSQSRTCKTHIYCPVNGQWDSWSEWTKCKNKNPKEDRTCHPRIYGYQTRERDCQYTAHNGSACLGDSFETRACFNIDDCDFESNISEWGEWGPCTLPCQVNRKGQPIKVERKRERTCDPDLSKYPETIGRNKQESAFWGVPYVDCKKDLSQKEPCQNVPACPLDEKNL